MERVRDNYNTQIQNLKDIRQYGSTQLSAVRGQYYEQVSRLGGAVTVGQVTIRPMTIGQKIRNI
jgi:hypothetical protein